MTKEQAIEILERTLEMTKPPMQEEIARQDILNDGYYYYTEEDLKAIDTVLNILKEKDKEIEVLEKQNKNLDKEAQAYLEELMGDKGMKERIVSQLQAEIEKKDKEIEFQKDINKIEKDRHKKTEKSLKGQISKKDKIINLMAGYIETLDIEEDICIKNKTNPDWCNEDYTNCKDCIKQYFERKAEEC